MSRHLASELPVNVVNDWIAVRDILHSGEIVGEIHVLLCAGLGTQIYRLTMLLDEGVSSTTAVPASTLSNRVSKTTDATSASEDEEKSMEDDKSCSQGSNMLPFRVRLTEARNLPLIHSHGKREPPVTYVTASNGLRLFKSKIAVKSCNPKWDFDETMHLPEQLLTDSKRQFIAKIWHKSDETEEDSSDYVIGFAAVDLGILLLNGFNEVVGW